jgi:hypothetical protein
MTSAFVPFVDDEQIHAIGCGLVQRTLPKSKWTHAAHFAAALWLAELNASDAMPSVIRAYNVATGVANTDTSGYHETITRASLRAARAFRAERPHLPLFEVCNALMASRFGRSDWVLDHWSRERLFSKEARGSWLEPDLLPLPF